MGGIVSCPVCPSVCLLTLRVRSITLILFKCFHESWNKYKPSSDNMQRTRRNTPPTPLRIYGPLKVFYENCVRSIISIPSEYFDETLYKYKPPSDDVQRKIGNSNYIFYGMMPL